ncbi:PepSY domain-containing protein [Acidihalobacter aeolianus]|nr:PepSY domain-containing protein [Acidihalobacter aeolianus]
MPMKKVVLTLIGASALSLGSGALYTAYAGEHLADQAKVTMQQARDQAMQVAPGKIRSAELEREHGGSGLRYSFDIQTAHGLREVGVDARSGKLLENSFESRKAEAVEMRSEHEYANRNAMGEHEHEHERDGMNMHEGEDD